MSRCRSRRWMRSSARLRRARRLARLPYPELIAEGRRMYRRLERCWRAELNVPYGRYDNSAILRSLEAQMRLLEQAFAARGMQL